MISCDRALELISERLDAPLSPEDQRALEEHLAVCADCRALLADFEEMERVLPTMNAPVPPDFTQSVLDRVKAEKVVDLSAARAARRPWKQWAATAAVFAVVLLGAGTLGLDQLADRFGGGSTAAAPTQDSAGLTAGAGARSGDTSASQPDAETPETAPAATQPQVNLETTTGGEPALDGDAPASSDGSSTSGQSTSPASGGGSQPSAGVSASASPEVATPAPEPTPQSSQLPRENDVSSSTPGIEPADMPYAVGNSLTLTEEQAWEAAFEALGGYDAYPDASPEDGTLATEADGCTLVLEDTGLSDNGKYYTFRLDRTFPDSTRTETVNFCAVPLSGGAALLCRDESLLENLSPEDPGWAEAKAAYDQAQQNYFDAIHN